ncbi:peptide chain release factor N(5)-glutamine methyltransferase [Lysobacter maris]|uniref:Release factor glutamine methyltransferase n=1 Tax=Marilutibacter maris TaxID=1605891 RepID=A0A508AT19_9GAMM|nr:peptide chain release factor N(5)-glutamine methyltransferase [Lysobacter maris]KAB8189686.1 peptide chain release factor N(5)-glutamine methyltransferase [Lysobacter maris]
MPRIDELLRAARADTEPGDAEALMAHALGRPASWLYAHGDDEPAAEAQAAFEALLARRRAGEPVAYLTGRRGFWRFELRVTADTLIPRPETERLVELALERLPADADLAVADLGTGSGAIALALALERPRARVDAVDASAAALAVARDNAAELAVGNVRFHHGSWFAPLAGRRYDLIASNPPYIADHDPHLRRGDLRAEPLTALASGPDGLDAIREIAAGAGVCLEPGGWLLIEHGWEQGEAVRAILSAAGLVEVATAQDLERRDRVTFGRRASGEDVL